MLSDYKCYCGNDRLDRRKIRAKFKNLFSTVICFRVALLGHP